MGDKKSDIEIGFRNLAQDIDYRFETLEESKAWACHVDSLSERVDKLENVIEELENTIDELRWRFRYLHKHWKEENGKKLKSSNVS